MAFCTTCGSQIPDNSAFCTVCGSPVTAQNNATPNQTNINVNFNQNVYQQSITGSTWTGGVLDTVITSIVAYLMIGFTCGIALPWALCYMMSFIIEHTVINGKRLRFNGTGASLFGNWIKWLVLCVITCGIYSFWVIPRLYKWIAEHITFEN